jgi:hypothetical protein
MTVGSMTPWPVAMAGEAPELLQQTQSAVEGSRFRNCR